MNKTTSLPNIFQSKSNSYAKLTIIRSIFFLLTSTLLICGLILMKRDFFRYFTQWGLTFDALYFGFGVGIRFAINLSKYEDKQYATLRKVYRAAFEVGWTISWLISIVYWLILFPLTINDGVRGPILMTIFDYSVHVIPLLGLILDMAYNQMDFMPYHVFYSISLILAFGFEDAIMVLCGKGEAYPDVLTWKDWLTVGSFIGFISISVGTFFTGYKISIKKLRNSGILDTFQI